MIKKFFEFLKFIENPQKSIKFFLININFDPFSSKNLLITLKIGHWCDWHKKAFIASKKFTGSCNTRLRRSLSSKSHFFHLFSRNEFLSLHLKNRLRSSNDMSFSRLNLTRYISSFFVKEVKIFGAFNISLFLMLVVVQDTEIWQDYYLIV